MGLTRRQRQVKAMVKARQSNIQSQREIIDQHHDVAYQPKERLRVDTFSSSSSGEESEDDILISDPEPFTEDNLYISIHSEPRQSATLNTAQAKFNNLFNGSPQAQKRGAASLPDLKGRAGGGDSNRNKRRKKAAEQQLLEENALCVPVNRMFERQLEGEANSESTGTAPAPLLPLREEMRAVLTHEQEKHRNLMEGIEALTRRLRLQSVRRAENLEGQWRRRHEMVLNFMHDRVKFPQNANGQAAIRVAGTFLRGSYVARRLIEWTDSWLSNRTIPRGERGIYRRMSTWYEDESLMLFIREFIAKSGDKLTSRTLSNAVGDYLYSNEHCNRVQEDLLLLGRDDGEEDANKSQVYKRSSIRARRARRWLSKLGLNYNDVCKGVYIDGHERDDFLKYRISFIKNLDELQPQIIEFNEDGTIIDKAAPRGAEGLKRIILCTHDESIFSANDSRRKAWMSSQNSFLRKKSKGRGIMLSDCLFPNERVHIPMSISDETMLQKGLNPKRRNATEYFEFGKNNEGYWTAELLVRHIVTVVIPMVELRYPPGTHQCLFLFDNATSHACFADDALRASEMNKEPGGKNPKHMRKTKYSTTGTINGIITEQEQLMVFPVKDVGNKFAGQPKGLRIVLSERGLWSDSLKLDCSINNCPACKLTERQRTAAVKRIIAACQTANCTGRMKCYNCKEQLNSEFPKTPKCTECTILQTHRDDPTKNGCCARRIMTLQPDFRAQKGMLQEKIEEMGHMVLFYPKFHCELNWIEYYWGRYKKYARDNCGYSNEALRKVVPEAVESVTKELIGRYFRKSLRILNAYKDGLQYGTPDFNQTVYKSHRRVRELDD